MLASGDPGFFGIARLVTSRLGREAVRIHPAPSSVALAFGAAGVSWDDALVVSAHGRPLADGLAAVVAAPKVAVLTAPDTPPEALGRALVAAGCGQRDVVVASRLGEADERVVATDLAGLAAGCFDPLSVVVLLRPDGTAAGPGLSWGRHEDDFAQRPGMITKAEVRAVALSKLALVRHGVLWDVGAGSGSVAVEAVTLAPGVRAYAIERDAADAANIAVNAGAAGVAVDVVRGHGAGGARPPARPGPGVRRRRRARRRAGVLGAPARPAADWWPPSSCSTGRWRRSPSSARWCRCTSIAPCRSGSGVRLEPLNPVFVCWGER